MIAEYIRYSMPPDKAGELDPAYGRAGEWLKKSPHCLGYELARCTEDAAQFILRINWDSHEGHLKGFRGSEEFKSFYREIAEFIPFIQEMRHYDLTGIRNGEALTQ